MWVSGRPAPTLAEAFREATLGLLDITGTWVRTAASGRAGVRGPATPARSSSIGWRGPLPPGRPGCRGVRRRGGGGRADEGSGRGALTPRGDIDPEGTAVKAITYHQLAVEERDGEWQVTVFVDV